MVLAYTFVKPYIFKICNGFSLYVYIYIYIKLILDSSVFVPNNLFTIKIKNLDGHVAKNGIPIKIQFRN